MTRVVWSGSDGAIVDPCHAARLVGLQWRDYLASNADLIHAFGLNPAAAFQHFLHSGFNEGRPTASFDALEYIEPPRVCRRPFRLSHAAMAGWSSMA